MAKHYPNASPKSSSHLVGFCLASPGFLAPGPSRRRLLNMMEMAEINLIMAAHSLLGQRGRVQLTLGAFPANNITDAEQ